MPSSGQTIDHNLIMSWLLPSLDVILVFTLTYLLLLIISIGERRAFLMFRGMMILMVISFLSNYFKLVFFSWVLDKLVIGSAVAMVVIFQTEFRRFLEQLGKGDITRLLEKPRQTTSTTNTIIDKIVDAVKELSQNRTGALIVMETDSLLDESDFTVPGVLLNAEISKELLLSIFQTTTILHDGAVFIRGSRIIAAGVILPLSDRSASRQLGTRHRAAMGITEQRENCLCIVVSEETGSISFGEKGFLNRPLTSTELKKLLEQKFSSSVEGEPVSSGFSRTIAWLKQTVNKRFFRFPPKKK